MNHDKDSEEKRKNKITTFVAERLDLGILLFIVSDLLWVFHVIPTRLFIGLMLIALLLLSISFLFIFLIALNEILKK